MWLRIGLKAIRGAAYEYPWFHRWMGLMGNVSFVIGSIFFLYKGLEVTGTWIFILASAGMMIDSFGEKLLHREAEQRHSGAQRGPAAVRTGT